MTKGTKSILFGVHQFLWHPFTVWLAWIYLYRALPGWRECICILVHDWGYWGKVNMDDELGETHPLLGAKIAHKLLDKGDDHHYFNLVLLHSRHYAKQLGTEPSKLCWADKASIIFEPWWLYLPRAWASGELAEYRMLADRGGFVWLEMKDRVWFAWLKERLKKLAREKRGNAVAYMNCQSFYTTGGPS